MRERKTIQLPSGLEVTLKTPYEVAELMTKLYPPGSEGHLDMAQALNYTTTLSTEEISNLPIIMGEVLYRIVNKHMQGEDISEYDVVDINKPKKFEF